ncbi:hypothetical protein ACX1C1_21685 [Paenibacillus sp. strain BS8-2]
MRQGLATFQRLLATTAGLSLPSEVKENEVASWIVNNARQFAAEVAAGAEELNQIESIMKSFKK